MAVDRDGPVPLLASTASCLALLIATTILRVGRTQLPHLPGAEIWAPLNFVCEDCVAIADSAVVYNPSPVRLGSHAVLSQQSYLCGASHDYDDPAFPQISAPISVGRYDWVYARARLLPGVTVGDGAMLGLGAIATLDLEEGWVYAGQPARKIRRRKIHGV